LPGEFPVALKVVLVSGLPATGKSTLAVRLAEHLSANRFSRDLAVQELDYRLAGLDRAISRMFGFRRRGLQERANERVEIVIVVGQHLGEGRSVVLDVVADADIRSRLEALALQHGAEFAQIEVVCSDLPQHRQRLRGRNRRWERIVERLSRSYEPPSQALLVDSVEAAEVMLDNAVRFIREQTAG
jgi:predicted kinase